LGVWHSEVRLKIREYAFVALSLAVVALVPLAPASFAATVIYVQTIGGLIYQSTDSAQTWQPMGVPIPSDDGFSLGGEALAVDPQNPNNLYATFSPAGRANPTQTQPGLLRSADGGQTWTEITGGGVSVPPIAVDSTASNIIYADGGQAAQGSFAGLDQVNVLLPRSLAGSGTVSLVLTASGQFTNAVNISIQ
jgi:uncharacterized protein (TIGR03437 family)